MRLLAFVGALSIVAWIVAVYVAYRGTTHVF